MMYETPEDREIMEAYMRRFNAYNRADARKIKRALRRLALT